ncbi:hypothetical protein D3C76_1438120 [compost metagenome]
MNSKQLLLLRGIHRPVNIQKRDLLRAPEQMSAADAGTDIYKSCLLQHAHNSADHYWIGIYTPGNEIPRTFVGQHCNQTEGVDGHGQPCANLLHVCHHRCNQYSYTTGVCQSGLYGEGFPHRFLLKRLYVEF